MTDLPEWLTAAANFDPAREHQPIVCTGGKGALSHPFEPVGWQFLDAAIGWVYVGRPVKRSDGTEFGFTIGATFGDTVAPVGVPVGGRLPLFPVGNWRASGKTSLTIRCPTCDREHRVKRSDWAEFLLAQRVSGAPWANVSDLD